MIRVAALIALLATPALAHPGLRDRLPADLPLDAEGIPRRPLNDDELHRLLLAFSAVDDRAALLLAACHAAGRGYGMPERRECITPRH